MDGKRTEVKRKTETTFDIGYSSDNERTEVEGWCLGRQS